MSISQQIESGLQAFSLPVSASLVDRSVQYLELIVKWNRVTNLTAVTDLSKMVASHLLDGFSVQPFITGQTTLDVGSGAGLPGIPLALLNPDKDFILLDSNGKKTRFMTQVTIELGLSNVEVVQSRVEDYSGAFDQVVCRAFTNLGGFVKSCERLLNPGGRMLAMKSRDIEVEQAELAAADYDYETHPVSIPGVNTERCIVEVSGKK